MHGRSLRIYADDQYNTSSPRANPESPDLGGGIVCAWAKCPLRLTTTFIRSFTRWRVVARLRSRVAVDFMHRKNKEGWHILLAPPQCGAFFALRQLKVRGSTPTVLSSVVHPGRRWSPGSPPAPVPPSASGRATAPNTNSASLRFGGDGAASMDGLQFG